MKKITLGTTLREKREELGLTQRELAAKLGVKASHVAYLENGRRRPSLSLLRRIADVMGLDRETIFLLAHPEARELLSSETEPVHARKRDSAWQAFLKDKALQTRYKIQPLEMKILRQVNMLGQVSSPKQYLFVLNSIRQAVEDR
jgi:transcriptional regulator with XRE-family HTH domain